jgi:hypothetical protein
VENDRQQANDDAGREARSDAVEDVIDDLNEGTGLRPEAGQSESPHDFVERRIREVHRETDDKR